MKALELAVLGRGNDQLLKPFSNTISEIELRDALLSRKAQMGTVDDQTNASVKSEVMRAMKDEVYLDGILD